MATEKKAKAKTRAELRAALLGSAPKPLTENIKIFGVEIELRQPTLAAILAAQDVEDTKQRSIDMIIEYAYVPGTDEKVFDMTDRDVILNWPFGADLMKLQTTIADLTGVDVGEAEEVLNKSPLKAQS